MGNYRCKISEKFLFYKTFQNIFKKIVNVVSLQREAFLP